MNSIASYAYTITAGAPHPAGGPGLAPSLLLVSDGPFVRRLIAEGLRNDGYRVREVDHRGLVDYAALRAAGQGEPVDAILCDAASLAPAGAQALRELRLLDWVMPIVVLAPNQDQQPTRDLCCLRLDAVVADVLDLDETRQAVAALLPLH